MDFARSIGVQSNDRTMCLANDVDGGGDVGDDGDGDAYDIGDDVYDHILLCWQVFFYVVVDGDAYVLYDLPTMTKRIVMTSGVTLYNAPHGIQAR